MADNEREKHSFDAAAELLGPARVVGRGRLRKSGWLKEEPTKRRSFSWAMIDRKPYFQIMPSKNASASVRASNHEKRTRKEKRYSEKHIRGVGEGPSVRVGQGKDKKSG